MKHLIRAAGLLVAILLIAFVLPRLIHFSNVKELKSYGFYAGTDNSQEAKLVAVQFADPIRCNTCHQDKHSSWIASVHKVVSCENCHGPGEQHIETGAPLVINISKQLCENCHATVLGRPATFPQIDPQQHHPQFDCITCHNPHAPVIPAIAHPEAGYTDCVLCHQTGGLKPFPADHQGLSSNACLTCHSR